MIIKCTKENLIKYLISEINELEPKDAYYLDYYYDLTDKNKNNIIQNINYKEEFINEINNKSEQELITFMKNTSFLPDNVCDEEVSKIINTYIKDLGINNNVINNYVADIKDCSQDIKMNNNLNSQSNYTDYCIIN